MSKYDKDRALAKEMATYKWQKDSRMEFYIEKYEIGEWEFIDSARLCVYLEDGSYDEDILDCMVDVLDLWGDVLTDVDKRAIIADVVERQKELV